MAELPLARFKVVDFSRVRAGPAAVRQLSDWGANVIKVEARDADAAFGFGSRDDADFQNLQRNKRSLTLDLKTPEGREVAHRLARWADVLVENFRPSVKHKLNIDYDTLSAINPRLIYASISGFGQDGPYKDRPCFDQIAQGMSGIMSVTGLPGQGPVRAGISVGDLSAGVFASMGVLLALLEREVSGKGQWVQVSLLSSLIYMMDYLAARWTTSKEMAVQAGNDHATGIPTSVYATLDGHVNIAAAGDEMFRRLCEALGVEDLISNPNYLDNASRSANRKALNMAIETITRNDTSANWIAKLNGRGVACGPIYNVKEVFDDPQVQWLNMTRHLVHKRLGELELIGQPIELSRTNWQMHTAAPDAGEHNDDVLREIGYGDVEICALRENKVV